MLKAGGTIEQYEAKADAIKASLRQELRCLLPACMLTVTVEAGSVILTVVATETAGAASQVESAAVALQTKDLDDMSSALGITIEETPSAPSVTDVQVQVTRLAPSPPPPPLPPPPLPTLHHRHLHYRALAKRPPASRGQAKTPVSASRLGSRWAAACSWRCWLRSYSSGSVSAAQSRRRAHPPRHHGRSR